jgi:hypothetical protein
VDDAVAADAREWAQRYVSIVERFDLCPWAAPARARGEVWIGACDESELVDALQRFDRTPSAVVGLCVLPGFTGDLLALRRVRNQLADGPIGKRLALAEFHPDAPLDATTASRLVPYLRRSPDPMLQAVRHDTLAGLRRGGTTLASIDQTTLMARHPIVTVRDVAEDIADANLARVQRDGALLAGELDTLIASRRDATRARSG